MRRLSIILGLIALVTVAAPATSSAQQSLSLYVGGFVPHGLDARDRDDVLLNNQGLFAFDISDFNGATVGGEYLVGLGDWFDAGLGVGFYRRTVPSVYYDFVDTNGDEIEQDLRLRVVPFTATFRFLPLGHTNGIEPYIGAGVGIFNYRYSETGSFVDFSDGTVFPARYVGSGTTTGPVVLGGVRFPVGAMAVGGEIRYQNAKGDLPLDQEFSGSKIDLGGWTYAATFNIRF